MLPDNQVIVLTRDSVAICIILGVIMCVSISCCICVLKCFSMIETITGGQDVYVHTNVYSVGYNTKLAMMGLNRVDCLDSALKL